MYSPPRGIAGNTFIVNQEKKFALVRTQETNSERALIYAACILRKERGIYWSSSIERRILRRMELWDAGKIPELVEDIVRAAKAGAGRENMPEDDDAIARRYHSVFIKGKLRAAVRWATNQSGGGMLAPSDIDAKTGKPVIDVLRDKHPDCRTPALEREGWASFEDYPPPRDGTPLDCDQEPSRRWQTSSEAAQDRQVSMD